MPVEMAVAVVATGVAALVLVTLRRRVVEGEMSAEFSGRVVDRRVEEVTLTTGIRQDRWLVVRTDTDELREVLVSPEVYDRFAVGDRIVKHAGVRWPEPG